MPCLDHVELCGGAGGQALGLETAGFACREICEIDPDACATLRANRPWWKVTEGDIRNLAGTQWRHAALLGGGVPCPPFTVAGQQLGADDERDLWPAALDLISDARPAAVMLENVKGMGQRRFAAYRTQIRARLHHLGYSVWWRLLNCSDHDVPQLRPRLVLVALRQPYAARFTWPRPSPRPPLSVGEVLRDMMGSRGWPGAGAWAHQAGAIAPTIVGGSRKHGGGDLGPTRARQAWQAMRVDGTGYANLPPGPGFPEQGHPKLTVPMVALLQGFPPEWTIAGIGPDGPEPGRKTAACRQVGNAFPPPAAAAVGRAIRAALDGTGQAAAELF
jgi:DNA (cytosine-5)-methyltransferase 1